MSTVRLTHSLHLRIYAVRLRWHPVPTCTASVASKLRRREHACSSISVSSFFLTHKNRAIHLVHDVFLLFFLSLLHSCTIYSTRAFMCTLVHISYNNMMIVSYTYHITILLYIRKYDFIFQYDLYYDVNNVMDYDYALTTCTICCASSYYA